MGEGFPCLFSKIGEKCPNFWKKNALIVVIYGLNFLFKMQFLRASRTKNRRFCSVGPFFLVSLMNVYRSALIPRKPPCPKKFLVTRLKILPTPIKYLSKLKCTFKGIFGQHRIYLKLKICIKYEYEYTQKEFKICIKYKYKYTKKEVTMMTLRSNLQNLEMVLVDG